MAKPWLLVPILLSGFLWAAIAAADPVRYDVTFAATWSSTTHAGAYPAGAHFSPLIGAIHNGNVRFWSVGGLATQGIERMAELGARSTLQSEIQTAISSGNAENVILGSGIGSPGSTTTSFEVSTAFPLVTLVSMIAPSPDWFVGVSGLDLRDGNTWREEVLVDLLGYDAGTDNGVNFTSPNADTNPKQAISLLGAPLAGRPPLGTFRFSLVSIPEPSSWWLAVLASLLLVPLSQRRRMLRAH